MHATSDPVSAAGRRAEANRANARKSTGPRSPEGKRRSSANSSRHQLLASAATLLARPNQELESLLARYHADFRPASIHEETLVQEIAVAAWRMKHITRIEAGLLALQMHEAYVAVTEEPQPVRWVEPMPVACSRCGGAVLPNAASGASDAESPALAEEPEDVRTLMLGAAWVSNPQAFSLLVRYQAQARRDYYRALKELERVRTGQAGYLPEEPPPAMARPIEPEPASAESETKPPSPAAKAAAAGSAPEKSETNPPQNSERTTNKSEFDQKGENPAPFFVSESDHSGRK